MGILSSLKKVIKTGDGGFVDVIELSITPEMAYKALALNNASSLIANAICGCEFVVYEDGQKVKNEEYYKLNVSPNPNQTASQFWHKVIVKMLSLDGDALCFETNQGLFCADSYAIKEISDLKGHKYNNIQLGEVILNRTFTAKDVYLFKLEEKPIKDFIDSVYKDMAQLLITASKSFKKSKATRFKFKVHGAKIGDDSFMDNYTNYLSKQIKAYVENDSGVYPEFDGYELVQDNTSNGASVDDFMKIKKDIFETASVSFKIPLSLMTGESRTLDEVQKQLLTFAVKPYIKMIEQTLNKTVQFDLWSQGYFIKVLTSGIVYHDPISDADKVEKLISSGTYCVDEVREKFGEDALNTEFSRTHWMTKNYSTSDDALKGGES